MSAGHSEASFNHSCLKVPVDSFSRKPFPNYERLSSAENSIKKGAQEKNSLFYDFNDNFKSVKSYLKFYESIPDYTELHHLSNEEFYSRLKTLKKTQKKFCSVTGALSGDVELFNEDLTENNSGESFDLDKETNEGGFYCTVCSLKKDYCHTSNSNKRTEARTKQSDPKMSINSDNENVSEFYEAEFKKHSDYEADRESSNLQVGEKPSNNTRNYFSMTNLGDECLSDKQRSKQLRNLRVSSGCEWDSPELCHRYLESNFR